MFHTGDYLSGEIYEDIKDIAKLKETMLSVLGEYNNSPGVIAMNLVLFRDAIEHCESIFVVEVKVWMGWQKIGEIDCLRVKEFMK